MVKTAFIHRLPGLCFSERCLLFEISSADGSEIFTSSGFLDDLLGRPYLSSADLATLCDDVKKEVAWLARHNGGIVAFPESGYPGLLREIYDPPFALYYRGNLIDSTSMVGMVGTRRPDRQGAAAAYGLGESLGRLDIPVVSGLARGIDCQAHRGNTAGGAAGVAVLGSGLAHAGPASSRSTAEELIRAGGALVSEYPVFSPATRFSFPMRNRIISGMSRSVVVVQAPSRSGALITADYALDQGREVLVHRDCLQSYSGCSGDTNEGCRRLAADGARAVSSGEELLRDWSCVWDGPAVQYGAAAV